MFHYTFSGDGEIFIQGAQDLFHALGIGIRFKSFDPGEDDGYMVAGNLGDPSMFSVLIKPSKFYSGMIFPGGVALGPCPAQPKVDGQSIGSAAR